ncbi:MAG: cysteine desulfurase [Trueperaceae bacterium]|nr:MAG: cysteine desulfurase [Trueperaceae bacterium]
MTVYLDYASSTPLDPLVLEAMLPYLTEFHGNPSSVHRAGQRTRRAVESARDAVACALGATSSEIIFTSGATEAINQVLRGMMSLYPGGHLITSNLEHAAVLATARHLEALGHPVTYLSPNAVGEITPEMVSEALLPETALVALMLVNNETGVRSDIAAISESVHEAGALLFCDAVQAFGFEAVTVDALGVDLLTVSGHKVYGPKGVGAIYVRSGLGLPPLMFGGSQERGRRPGTYNTAAIVGMGEAASLAGRRWTSDAEKTGELRDTFEAGLVSLPGVSVNGGAAPRGVKHSNLRFDGVDTQALLMALDTFGICASGGSACAAGSVEASHVLTAMGLTEREANTSIRFSFGRQLERVDLERAVSHIREAVKRCRSVGVGFR